MSQPGRGPQRIYGLALFSAALVLFAFSPASNLTTLLSRSSHDRVVKVRSDDPEMLEAVQRARASLPLFWSKFSHPAKDEDAFALKLAIRDGSEVEHMWCGSIVGTAEKARCKISNEPESVKTVQLGQEIEVDPAIISDWMYMRSGHIKGGESIRVLVSRMPEEEAAAYADLLSRE